MTGKRIAVICTGLVLTAGILTACGRRTSPETIIPKETEVQTSVMQNQTEERSTEGRNTETTNTETPNTETPNTETQNTEATDNGLAETEMITEVPETVVLEAYIQEIDGKILILADEDGGLYQMDTEGVDIRIPAGISAEEGTEAGTEKETSKNTEDSVNQENVQQLQPGMAVDIVYSGILMRNIPATLPQVERVTVVSDREDPYGFYRTLLQTIWDTNPELNEGIEFVALDFTDAENITDNQKYVLEYVMRNIAQCEVRIASDDQLEREGILNDERDQFSGVKGMLISIDDERRREDQIQFDAEKWISDTTEVEWDDQTARYENGRWELTGR